MIVTGSLDGADTVIAKLNTLVFDTKHMQKFITQAGSAMVASTQANFLNQTAPDGTSWLPSLRAKVQGGQTLRDTGRLLNSLTYSPLPDGVEWGTNVFYAPFLHYGATIRAVNAQYLRFKTVYGWVTKEHVILPARPFLGFKPSDHQTVIDIISDILQGAS